MRLVEQMSQVLAMSGIGESRVQVQNYLHQVQSMPRDLNDLIGTYLLSPCDAYIPSIMYWPDEIVIVILDYVVSPYSMYYLDLLLRPVEEVARLGLN